jgi:GT2 family glycosyltransferase
MNVTILIINQNGQEFILDTLDKISEFYSNLDVLIVDNASGDKSTEIISQKYPQIEIVSNPSHLSYSESLNVGFTRIMTKPSEYIWLVGSDVLVDVNSLKYLMELAEKYKDVGMVSSKIYDYPDRDHKIYFAGGIMDWNIINPVNRGQGQIDVGQFEHDIETDFVLPYSTLIKCRVIKEVGFLDTVYYDKFDWLDYCFKNRRLIWRLMYSCQSHVWIRQKNNDDLPIFIKEYFSIRNSLLLGLRFGPAYTKFSLIKDAFHQYFFGTPWQRRAVLDFFTGNFGRGSYQME